MARHSGILTGFQCGVNNQIGCPMNLSGVAEEGAYEAMSPGKLAVYSIAWSNSFDVTIVECFARL